jgi:hypothetical protein
VKKSETVKKGLFEPFLSIFNYQWPFILFKNLINHSNNGPKNKLRVESIGKYQLKKQHRSERARRLVKFFKNRN